MSNSRIRIAASLLLAVTCGFAVDSMFGQLYRVGMFDEAVRILSSTDASVAVLPGSNTPILQHFTGWQPLDKLLALANVMFANVADGSRPQLSLYAVQFGAQLMPIFSIIMIESLRVGNASNSFY